MSAQCGTCGGEDTFTGHPGGDPSTELRPYGPGGSPICHACAFATPEAEKRTSDAFTTLLTAAEAVSPVGVAVLGDGSHGPTPFDPTRPPEIEDVGDDDV